MYARQTTVKAPPANLETGIEQVRTKILPALRSADGFKGFTLLADRDEGLLVGTSYFESREALEASEAVVRGPREQIASEAGAADVTVRIFEVVTDEQV